MSEPSFTVLLEQQEDYRFQVDFGQSGVAPLVVDEPPPLGEAAGPNPSRLVATAVGNCLAASLLFCLRKAHLEPSGMQVAVQCTLERNDKGRLRLGKFDVVIDVSGEFESLGRFERCVGMFEDYCVVTASVRQGIEVVVTVNVNGTTVHRSVQESAAD